MSFSANVSGTIRVKDLIPDYAANKDTVTLKLTIDPNRLAIVNKYPGYGISVSSACSYVITTEGGKHEISDGIYIDAKTGGEEKVYELTVSTTDTIYYDIQTPLVGGWVTPGGSWYSGGIGSGYVEEGYDSNPPEPGSTLIKYTVCISSTYDPSLN